MKPARILIVEDDESILSVLRVLIERAGMMVIEATDGRAGLRAFYKSNPDLVILDVEMPELDGWQVLDRIRELSEVPVMMLTARADELDKVRGLREGADDYLTKPIARQELVARIEALLRRAGGGTPTAEVHADELLEIDFPQRRVAVHEHHVELTPTEFKLIAAFARHPNQVLSHDQLLEMVWGDAAGHSPQQVKLYVGYLRRKIRDAAGVEPIETVRGFGYRYSPTLRPTHA
jgi:DNA-binding response OmpR family regulator